jgi:hypothetical protein
MPRPWLSVALLGSERVRQIVHPHALGVMPPSYSAPKEDYMSRGKFVSLALAAGLLIATNISSTQAASVVATSPAAASHSLVQKVGRWEYCYWKLKKNGKWKLKCED